MFSKKCKSCGEIIKERYKGLCLDCFMKETTLTCSNCGKLTPINNLIHGHGTDNTGKEFYYCGSCLEKTLKKSILIDYQETMERYNRALKRIQHFSPDKFSRWPDGFSEINLSGTL